VIPVAAVATALAINYSGLVWRRRHSIIPFLLSLPVGIVSGIVVFKLSNPNQWFEKFWAVELAFLFSTIGGALLGYIAGNLCASVFLLTDVVDSWLDPTHNDEAASEPISAEIVTPAEDSRSTE